MFLEKFAKLLIIKKYFKNKSRFCSGYPDIFIPKSAKLYKKYREIEK